MKSIQNNVILKHKQNLEYEIKKMEEEIEQKKKINHQKELILKELLQAKEKIV